MEADMKIVWEDYLYMYSATSWIKQTLSHVLIPLDEALRMAPMQEESCNSAQGEPCPAWEAAKANQVCCLQAHLEELKTVQSKIIPELASVTEVLQKSKKYAIDLLELYQTYMSFLNTKDPRLLSRVEETPYSKDHELFKTKVELRRAREELKDMNAILAARDKEIVSRREELSSRVQTILKKDLELKFLTQSVSHLEKVICNKNEELAKKERLMSKKEQVILVKEQELCKRRQELERMEQQLRRNEQLLQCKELELSRNNKEITRLTQCLQLLGQQLPPSNNSASRLAAPVDVKRSLQALPRASSRIPPRPASATPEVKQPSSSPHLRPLSPRPPIAAFDSSPGPVSSSTPVSDLSSVSPEGGLDIHGDLVCKVCVQEEATALFHPCRHLLCGPKCAEVFCGQGCPVCRARIESWVHVFRA